MPDTTRPDGNEKYLKTACEARVLFVVSSYQQARKILGQPEPPPSASSTLSAALPTRGGDVFVATASVQQARGRYFTSLVVLLSGERGISSCNPLPNRT